MRAALCENCGRPVFSVEAHGKMRRKLRLHRHAQKGTLYFLVNFVPGLLLIAVDAYYGAGDALAVR